MLRQTIVLAATLFVVWGMGVAILALYPDANSSTDLAVSDALGPRYLVNTRTTSAYQDPTGRYTVYVRTALRDRSDVREVEKY